MGRHTRRGCLDVTQHLGLSMARGIDFALAMIGKWGGLEKGQLAELLIEDAPQPPFGVGRPELASSLTLAAAQSILAQEIPAALVETAARPRGFAHLSTRR